MVEATVIRKPTPATALIRTHGPQTERCISARTERRINPLWPRRKHGTTKPKTPKYALLGANPAVMTARTPRNPMMRTVKARPAIEAQARVFDGITPKYKREALG
jgi:hypothetical protein